MGFQQNLKDEIKALSVATFYFATWIGMLQGDQGGFLHSAGLKSYD